MTTFIGIDLAWGGQAATGLATIDEAGRIEDIATALTDGEIVEYVQRRMAAPCSWRSTRRSW
jgi:predicted RNase H-like nuclease